MIHRFSTRVYYEDTDLGGIVYHANYLKFIERARSEWVESLGLDQNAMREAGQVFAVTRIEADFLRPARLGDRLEVETEVAAITPRAPRCISAWGLTDSPCSAPWWCWRACRARVPCGCPTGCGKLPPDDEFVLAFPLQRR